MKAKFYLFTLLLGLLSFTTYAQKPANCTPDYSSPSYYITEVKFESGSAPNGWTNTTNAQSTDGYGDFTGNANYFATLSPNQTYTLKVTANNGTNRQFLVKVYFDWNDNGSFQASELVDFGSKSAPPYEYTRTFTVPATAVTTTIRMRVVMGFSNNAGSCDSEAWGEAEDYAFFVCDGVKMQYDGIDTSVASLRPTVQGAANQGIMGFNFKADGCADELKITGVTFGDGNSSNLSADVNSAKLFFTGASAAFATSEQVGSTGTINNNFAINSMSKSLLEGDNWFWLTYDVKGSATAYNLLDAELLSIKYDSAGVSKTINYSLNTKGERQIIHDYCAPTPANQTGYHINTVTIGSRTFNNNGAAATNRYGDYVLTNPIPELCVGNDYALGLTATQTSERLYANPTTIYTHAYFDWNHDGDFDDEQEHLLLGNDLHVNTVGLNRAVTVTGFSVAPPAFAVDGYTVMRVTCSNTAKPDPCVGFVSGETEDYLIKVNSVGYLSVNTSPVLCNPDSVDLLVLQANSNRNYSLQSSPNGTTWNDVASTTNFTSFTTGLLDTTTFYRLKATNAICPSGDIKTEAYEIAYAGVKPVQSDKDQICLNDTAELNSSFEFPAVSFSTFTDVPANGPGTYAEFPITVENLPYGILSQVNLDSVCLDFGSSDAANTFIYLKAPGGEKNILLSNGRGANAADSDFNRVCFTKHATTAVADESGVLNGTYTPDEDWDKFIGIDPNGDWTFAVATSAGLGSSYIDQVFLHFGFNTELSWTPTDSIVGASNADTIRVNPSASTTYKASLSNPYCTSVDSTTITVLSGAPITINIDSVRPLAPICDGTEVFFYASLSEQIDNAPLKWFVNGTEQMGENGFVFSSSNLTNGAVVKVDFDLTTVCGNFQSDDSETVSIMPIITPTLSMTVNQSLPVCEGTSVTFTATANDFGPNPVYEWFVNGNSVQQGGTSYQSSSLNNGDLVEVEVSTDYPCATKSSDKVGITFATTTELDPEITLVSDAAPDLQCLGREITFTADTAFNNAGGRGTIKWFVDGIMVNVNSLSTSSDTFSTGTHFVRVEYHVNSSCTKSNLVSASVQFEVGEDVIPKVEFSASNELVCRGDSIFFTITKIENGGANPQFQWFKNSQPISGETGTVFATNNFRNQDEITVRLISSIECVSFEQAFGSVVVVRIAEPTQTEINITSDYEITPFCEGAPVKVETDYILGGGVEPIIEWFLNENKIQKSSLTFVNLNTLKQGDKIYAKMYPNSVCPTPVVPVSDTISFQVNPLPVVDYQAVQNGNDMEFIPNNNEFVSYKWEFGTGESSVQINPTYQYNGGGDYQTCLTVVDQNGCSNKKCKSVRYTPTVSVLEKDGNETIKLFPNPNNGEFFITGIQGSEVLSLVVLDLRGNQITLHKKEISLQKDAIGIKTQNLASGVYLLQIQGRYKVSHIPFVVN